MRKRPYVYDLETILNCFTACFKCKETKEIYTFVIHSSRNDVKELRDFLKGVGTLIGFNNVKFDSQVLQYVINNIDEWIETDLSGEEIATRIYEIAQLVIESEFPIYRKWEITIPNIDLFLILHLNNKARRCSLKDIQIALGWYNVEDMPIPHDKPVEDFQIPQIISYNINDVQSTNKLDDKCVDLKELRDKLSKKYGIDCTNYNDGKIGEELLLKFYCEKTKQDPKIVRQLRTERQFIKLKDCIPSYIKFNLRPFRDVLSYFQQKVIYSTRGAFKYELDHLKCVYTYGTGGIHANVKSGVYESNEEYIIKTFDVASLYPSLAVVNRFYPDHLGEEFCDIYNNEIVAVRLAEKSKPKGEQDKVMIDGYKYMANVPYGKSNSEFSFLMDSMYTMKTCVTGELSITMLLDMLLSEIPSLQVLMVNTDGAEVRIRRQDEDAYNVICAAWEAITGLVLEFDEYQKIVLQDINSYLGIYTNGKVKKKGRFVDKPELWQDHSQLIVAKALEQYYVNNIPVENTINNSTNILDFCKRAKMTKGNKLTKRYIKDGDYIEEDLSKTTRYYVSEKGSSLIKVLPPLDKKRVDKLKMLSSQSNIFDFIEDIELVEPDDRETNIEAGWLCTVYNKHDDTIPFEEHKVNKQYYLNECYKIINTIKQ